MLDEEAGPRRRPFPQQVSIDGVTPRHGVKTAQLPTLLLLQVKALLLLLLRVNTLLPRVWTAPAIVLLGPTAPDNR